MDALQNNGSKAKAVDALRHKDLDRAEYRFRISPVEQFLLDQILEMQHVTLSTWARQHIREDAQAEGLSALMVQESSNSQDGQQ